MSTLLDIDHWREILHALGAKPLRTFMTALGVFWGILLLVIMLGAGDGLKNGVLQNYSDATNSFFLWTQQTSKPYRGYPPGRGFEMNLSDAQAIRHQVPEAHIIAPRSQLGGFRGGNNVIRKNQAGAFEVMGDVPEVIGMESFHVTRGRFINRFDLEDRRKVAVIGARVVEILFEKDEKPIGESIEINGVHFKVVGILGSKASGDQIARDLETIIIPLTTFQRAFNTGDDIGWFAITSDPGVPASQVREKVQALLSRRHQVAPDDDRAFGHYNTEEDFNEAQGLFRAVEILVWIVGIGTLTAGVIGVSNIMLVIVRERTREIGIRRAIGATPLSVVVQIVVEAVLLTSLAGYLGLVGGFALVEVAAAQLTGDSAPAAFLNPSVGIGVAGQALLILIAAGTLAGVIPAQRAVRIDTVAALRAE